MDRFGRALVLGGIILAAFAVWSSHAFADQPQVVEYKVLDTFSETGPLDPGTSILGDHFVLLEIFAIREWADSWVLISFPGISEDPPTAGRPVGNLDAIIDGKEMSPEYIDWRNPGPIWRAYSHAKYLLIPPGESVRFWVVVDFLRDVNRGVAVRLPGRVHLVERSQVDFMKGLPPEYVSYFVKDRKPAGYFSVDLFYRIGQKRWAYGNYEEIFGIAPEDPLEGRPTDDYDAAVAELPVLVHEYRKNLPIPGNLEDDKGELLRETIREIYRLGSGKAGDRVCDEEDVKRPEQRNEVSGRANSHNLSGTFSTKWASDHSLHPGFGWKVEAWTNEDGPWEQLVNGWVQSDGTWSLGVDTSKGFEGRHLRMVYRPVNGYFQPRDRNDNTYRWRDPDRTNIGTNFYAGHRYADTDGGTHNGVGDLYDSGYRMWSRLHWIAGVNPVPPSPIKMYFPNTWYNCGSGSSPWSCANSGEIWLIASHGIQGAVVTHELAHQLNNKYWGNKKPANSGGNHNLSSCYPTRLGMTLREGFANFMPAWVGYQNRNVAEGGFNTTQWNLGFDDETRNAPPNCSNGWEAELWVARIFWDLHDTRSDGDDILWFIHKGAVIALYLNNGVANDGDARDMRFYENIYRDAATNGHEGFITDIFEQNRH